MKGPMPNQSLLRSLRQNLADTAGGGRVNMLAVAMAVAVTGLLAVMVGRVAQLQLAPSERLAAHKSERLATVVEPARRGDITDRRGRVLAATRFGSRVIVDPEQFPTKGTDEAIVKLAAAMGVPVEQIGPRIVSRMAQNAEKKAANAELEAQAAARAKELAAAAAAGEETSLDPAGDAESDAPLALSRYVPLGGVLDDSRIDLIKGLKIKGVHLETRQVREVNADDVATALVGKVGFGDKGLLASEKLLDKPLRPTAGSFSYTADARRRPIWVDDQSYVPPVRGQDTALAIDLEIQRITAEELERGVVEADAAGGRAVVMDPATGEILAMVDIVRDLPGLMDYDWQTPLRKDEPLPPGVRWRIIGQDKGRLVNPALARNRCVEDVYEPGSTFKAFMWAAVTELQLAKPTEVFNTYGGTYKVPYGQRWVRDVHGHGTQTWQQVLVNSSNIGMTIGCARMSFAQHHAAIRKFGFGQRPSTGLPGETAGIVTPLKDWTNWTQTSCSYGYQVGVTPVQVARAFSAFAGEGDANGVLPPARFLAAGSGDGRTAQRVLPRWVADITRETMRGVTASLDRRLAARAVPEKGWRYELFGKSGTAQAAVGEPPRDAAGQRLRLPKGGDGYFPQYNSSFVAGGPVERPRLVMIAVIDDPGPELVRRREHRGATVAGPVVRRTMERALAYLGVPPSPPVSDEARRRAAE